MPGQGDEHAAGPRVHGRAADPFAEPHAGENPRPGDPDREVPIGVPETPDEFEERKRAAALPDPPDDRDDGAQTDRGDDGS